MEKPAKNIIGVLGGMGPLASSEFTKTIYEYCMGNREQEFPIVFTYSDPTIPDRTESFMQGDSTILLRRFKESIESMCSLGVSKIITCCVTIHYLFPELPEHYRNIMVSLIDIVVDRVLQTGKRYLLICTKGTYQMRIFQNHPQWEEVKNYIILPDEEDQKRIHHLIYGFIKINKPVMELTPFLFYLRNKYRADAFIAGCTEIHLITKALQVASPQNSYFTWLDPLNEVAMEVADGSIWKTKKKLAKT